MPDLEEKIAHLMRAVDDLSEVVARQDRDIAALDNRVRLLLAREADRQDDESGGITLGDARPPHY